MRALRSLFAAMALFLSAALVPFVGAPLCSSRVCPMSAADRAACTAMGRECCGTRGGQVAKAPAAPVTFLAPLSSAVAFAAPLPVPARVESPTDLLAPAAIVQGVGLFTLHAVFLI